MAHETFADELRAAVAGDKHTIYTELMLQAAELLDEKMYRPTPVAPVSPDAIGNPDDLPGCPACGDAGRTGNVICDICTPARVAIGECGELVSVGAVNQEIIGGVSSGQIGIIHPVGYDQQTIELVTRSQAVELLAVKDVIIRSHLATIATLNADNTALTARVKETEDCYLKLCEAIGIAATNAAPVVASEKLQALEAKLTTANGKIEALVQSLAYETAHEEAKRVEALEAKLAAAEKALEPFADHANDRAVDDTGWRDKETVKIVVSIGDLRKARAVLGGKPS